MRGIWRWLPLFGMLVSLPWVFSGAQEALRFEPNSPLTWMPPEFPARRSYDQFARDFETGEVLVVSWEGCGVDDPRLDRFADQLLVTSDEKSENRIAADGEKPFFARVLTGRATLRTLTSAPLELSSDVARQRLRGVLIGPDGQASCAIVLFTPEGVERRSEAVAKLLEVLTKDCGIPQSELRIVGPVMDGLTVDVASSSSFRDFALPSGLVMFSIAWMRLKSLRLVAAVLGLAAYAEALTLACLHWGGGSLNALLIVMPPLVLAVAVAGGIHLANYYVDAVREKGVAGAAGRALRIGWLPCALSAGTTAAGLASLVISDIEPIQAFGQFAALGVMIALGLTLAVLPPILEFCHRAEHRVQSGLPPIEEGQAIPGEDANTQGAAPRRNAWPLRLHGMVRARYHGILICSLSVVAVLGTGIPYLHSSVHLETLFGPDSEILRNYAWMEGRIGPLVPIEICLRIDRSSTLRFRDRMELTRRVEQALHRIPEVGGTMSAASFAPPPARGTNLRGLARRVATDRGLERHRQQFVDMRYLHVAPEVESWRITARISAVRSLNYGDFLKVIDAVVQRELAMFPASSTGVSAEYTGVMPLVHVIQDELMGSLFWSFVSALVCVTLIVMGVERGFVTGLIAMIPNVFPILLMFGLLGWLNVPLDIGMVMTASVALGLAIDGTLHFLTFFHRGVAQGRSPRDAVREAFAHCAEAMTESSLIIGLGMLVFALTPFQPGSRFAWMIALLLAAALYGDLVLLPAILFSRAGRWFVSEPQRGCDGAGIALGSSSTDALGGSSAWPGS